MTNYLTTLNHDLQGCKKLILEGKASSNFNSAPVFSLFRDTCLILYETNKVLKEDGVIKSDLPNMDVIKEIRHKVKSTQSRNNSKIFNRILNQHKSVFGDDIDNLGFYLDNEILASSTLFPTFVFDDTVLSNSPFNKEIARNFSFFLGSLIHDFIDAINQPIKLTSNPMKMWDEEVYSTKDIWHKRFFKEDITYNVFLIRLLFIQNELTTCVWMEKHLDYNSQNFNLDKYILLRLSSIKLHETMRNILDIRNREGLKKHWETFNLNRLESLINQYQDKLEGEMLTLRNMLHYDNKGVNFYDYIEQKLDENSQYPDELIETIFNDFIHKIRNIISISINIKSYESMTDDEIMNRRLNSLNLYN
ncbi:hypothetical protein MOC76_16870 [Bacillus spizizenii]|nr:MULTISPECIES: hypothetical protein [Bacillus subtilis group]MBG9771211.1 hypothetical protein [Bacillus vallismortis]MCY8063960.1 hypothetical protein [Bacillus spizizenii]MCY8135430.1 hypothetical protein [Bacillus spizizenii]MCY8260454.1 hypothetical protein [Bacillus spizizenii]MEC1461612.1 hypothetical protein [Bacillus spizizenii]